MTRLRLLAIFLLVIASLSKDLKGQEINPENWTLTFEENFDSLSVSAWGPIGSNQGDSKWIAHTPYNGDFGVYFADPNDPWDGFPFTIENGKLRIEARLTGNDPCETWGDWHGGLLSSSDPDRKGFFQKHGYFECRAKMPQGPGTWPAFWLNSWEGYEIDIVEHYGHHPEDYHVVLHDWVKDWHHGPDAHLACAASMEYLSCLTEDYHTYGALIEPDTIRFYLDRKEVWKYPTPVGFRYANYYVMVNLALGSGWSTCETPNPSYMYVDYIKAWEYDAPTCKITNPVQGSSFASGEQVIISVEAVPQIGNIIDHVDFYQNDSLIGTVVDAPYTLTISNVAPGFHTYSAVATNQFGKSTSSDGVIVQAYTQSNYNIAWKKPSYASTTEGNGFNSSYAVDGNINTRWSSEFEDPQWIYVDFENTYDVNTVKIFWENAYATGYEIQISEDAHTWETIYIENNGNGESDIIDLNATGRFLRMYGTSRFTEYGYSIYELEVYGTLHNSTRNLHVNKDLIIYPNPANNVVFITHKHNQIVGSNILLFNKLGKKMVVEAKFENGTTQLNLDHLPSGIYFLKIEFENHDWIERKFLIHK